MRKVVHFEISSDDPKRAVKFYKEVFNWKIEKRNGPVENWTVTTGTDEEPGINGAIVHKYDSPQPVVNTINVPSIEEYLKRIEKAGGMAVTPKAEIPGVGFHAYFKDSEGNLFGLIEENSGG